MTSHAEDPFWQLSPHPNDVIVRPLAFMFVSSFARARAQESLSLSTYPLKVFLSFYLMQVS